LAVGRKFRRWRRENKNGSSRGYGIIDRDGSCCHLIPDAVKVDGEASQCVVWFSLPHGVNQADSRQPLKSIITRSRLII
jgi:hypothetical protein